MVELLSCHPASSGIHTTAPARRRQAVHCPPAARAVPTHNAESGSGRRGEGIRQTPWWSPQGPPRVCSGAARRGEASEGRHARSTTTCSLGLGQGVCGFGRGQALHRRAACGPDTPATATRSTAVAAHTFAWRVARLRSASISLRSRSTCVRAARSLSIASFAALPRSTALSSSACAGRHPPLPRSHRQRQKQRRCGARRQSVLSKRAPGSDSCSPSYSCVSLLARRRCCRNAIRPSAPAQSLTAER